MFIDLFFEDTVISRLNNYFGGVAFMIRENQSLRKVYFLTSLKTAGKC